MDVGFYVGIMYMMAPTFFWSPASTMIGDPYIPFTGHLQRESSGFLGTPMSPPERAAILMGSLRKHGQGGLCDAPAMLRPGLD